MAFFTSLVGSAQNTVAIQNEDENDVANKVESVGSPRKVAGILAIDVNGDGVVNAIDVVDIIKYVRNENPRSVFNKSKADVNGDGVVDIKDAEDMSSSISLNTNPAGDPGDDDPPIENTVLRGNSLKDPTLPQ